MANVGEESFQIYHLESRWRSPLPLVLVYHGPLQIATELGSGDRHRSFHHGVFCEEFPNHPIVFEVLKSLETLEPPEAFDPGLHPGNFTKTWILLVPLLVLKLGNKETKNDYACLFFQHLAKHGNSGVFLKRLNYMTQGPKQYAIHYSMEILQNYLISILAPKKRDPFNFRADFWINGRNQAITS